MGSTVKARTLKGFKDYLPADDQPRQAMFRTIAGVFESFGFGPLTTPALEYTEALLGKYGDEGDKLLYRFRDNGDRDVAMRYDLTVPLARVVAQHRSLDKPFKRYQIAPVWRAEKPGRGRFREFVQCDVDIVGEAGLTADAEVMMVGLAALEALGVPRVSIRVNNRKILDGLMETVGVDAEDQRRAVLRAVDKLPKIGRDGVAAELAGEVGLGSSASAQVLDFVEAANPGRAELDVLAERVGVSERGREGVAELRELLRMLDGAGVGDRVSVDLSIARGLDYYTGAIYETFVGGREGYGSVMSGGRYDTLLGMFLKQSEPAVGISIGVDRLLSVLVDLDLVATRAAMADVFLTLFDAGTYGPTAKLATELRAAGLGVELSLKAGKLGKQFKLAQKKGFRWVVVAGPDELAAGKVQLKDLASGEQVAVDAAGVAAAVRLG